MFITALCYNIHKPDLLNRFNRTGSPLTPLDHPYNTTELVKEEILWKSHFTSEFTEYHHFWERGEIFFLLVLFFDFKISTFVLYPPGLWVYLPTLPTVYLPLYLHYLQWTYIQCGSLQIFLETFSQPHKVWDISIFILNNVFWYYFKISVYTNIYILVV